jgi:hypothetical protein
MIKINLILGFLFLSITSFAQKYNAELICQKTSIVINKGSLSKDLYFEIKINNRAGEKYAKISIPYSKLNKLSNIKAFIKDSDGRIVRKLKKNEIITRSSISDFSFYEDDFVKEFTLKHNAYPYTIVYSYQIQQSEFLYIDYWIPVIDRNVPTLTAGLLLSVPLNYRISYKNNQIKSYRIDTIENRINYQWTANYTDLIKSEIYSPPVFEFVPSVAIIPLDFKYESEGSFKDWGAYGNWQFGLLKGLNELPDRDKNKIHTLINNVTDDKEKIKILYHFLQDETRYVNVTMETGGLKPYPASYVAQNKYGDCKALTNYFKSILDYIQIPSYYTKVYAGNPINDIDKNFPSQQFNHVILYIPQKEEDIWLDCTSDGAFNYLGTFTQNRDAFIIDYNNSNFIKTPALKPDDVLVTRKVEINYNANDATVKFQNSYKGDSYENILHLNQNFSELEKAKIVRNYIVSDGFELKDYKIVNVNRDSVKIELNYEATSQDIFKNYGNDMLVKNLAFSLPNFEKPQNRNLPVQIDYPIFKIDTIIYNLPIGYKLHKTQDKYTVQNKHGEYKFKIYENDETVMVIKSLLINPGFYPITEYDNFYDFYKQVVEIENKTHLSLYK